jgi:hypothetical protein
MPKPVCEDRDHPLSFHWRPVSPNAFEGLHLPPAGSKATAIARVQIITEAFVLGRADPRHWLSYSRRKEFYAERRGRYWPKTFTYSAVVPTVDQLAALGLLENEIMPPGNLGWQSRFKASPELMKQLNETPLAVIHYPHEVIILRDRQGNLIDYRETERSSRWRRHVQELNDAIMSEAIGLRGNPIHEGDPLLIGKVSIGAATNRLHRVFNRSSFSLGGRFYGGWWQNIPSECRADITINGLPTIELDYPRLHPTLFYAEIGSAMYGDPYDLADWPRGSVKIAFNTLVNADTREAAIRSIAHGIGGQGAYAKAESLICDIEAKHPLIAPMFGSGAGLRLMRRDSDMAESLMLRLVKRGVLALPIHDSFIVPDRNLEKGELMEGMAQSLHKAVQNDGRSSIGYLKSVPQYGAYLLSVGGAPESSAQGPPVGSIMVFFPELQQHDLFGPNSLAVPISDVLGWRGGVAPVGIRIALRHEMRRRGLRPADLAQRFGISRSQFGNILQGRYGSSRPIAAEIRNFLIEGAKTVGSSDAVGGVGNRPWSSGGC